MNLTLLRCCGGSFSYRASYVAAHIRTISYGIRTVDGPISMRFPGYNLIFEYKHAKRMAMCNRLKLYQTIVTPLYMVGQTALDYYLSLHLEPISTVPILLFGNLIAMFLLLRPYDNVVLYMYKGGPKDQIIVSYCTTWGKRKDIFLKPTDIQVTRQAQGNWSLSHLLIHPKNIIVKLPVKFGIVHNQSVFSSIFGGKLLQLYSK